MKRNGCKARELNDNEKYYRIEYKSKLDTTTLYWHKAVGRNVLEAKSDFESELDVQYLEDIKEPIEL
jgi:hypothetical protein